MLCPVSDKVRKLEGSFQIRIQPEQLCFHPFYILEAVFVNARYSRLIWTDILFIIQDYCSKVQVF